MITNDNNNNNINVNIKNSYLCKRPHELCESEVNLDSAEAERSSAEMKRELETELEKISTANTSRNPISVQKASSTPEEVVIELMDSLFSTSRVDKLLYTWFFDRSHHEDMSVRLAWMIRTLGECRVSFELNSDCVLRVFNSPVLSIHFTEFTSNERRLVVQMISDWRFYFGEKKRFKSNGFSSVGLSVGTSAPHQFAVFRKSPHNPIIASRVCSLRLCARLFALILMNARANPRTPARVPRTFVSACMIMDKTVQNYEQRRSYVLTNQAERDAEHERLRPLRDLLEAGSIAIIYGWTADNVDFLPQLMES